MPEDPRLYPFLAALVAATCASAVALFIFRRNRTQNCYVSLRKLISDHNVSLLREKIGDGLPISNVDPKVVIVCNQHLNLLFYAWLNRRTIEADGSLEGWKNWSSAIVAGAKLPNNEQYRAAYFDILSHGDLYPVAFRHWLDQSLHLSNTAFTPNALPQPASGVGRMHNGA